MTRTFSRAADLRFSHTLITRPEPEASDLAHRLGEDGIPVLVSPALGFESLSRPLEIPGPIAEGEQRLLVFTSPRSVAYGLDAIPAEMLDRSLLAAIGPATARALAKQGHTAISSNEGHHTSEDLLRHPWIRDHEGMAVIVTAPGGRETLKDGLGQCGWRVHELQVYRRVPLPPAPAVMRALAGGGAVLSTWTSGEAMESVLAALDPPARDAVLGGVFVVISERLGRQATELGAHEVLLADGPGNAQLRRAVLDAWGRAPDA